MKKKESKIDKAFETGKKDPGLYRFTMLATYGITGFMSFFVAFLMIYFFFRFLAPSTGLVWIMVGRLLLVWVIMWAKDKYPFVMILLILFLDVFMVYFLLNLGFTMFRNYINIFRNLQVKDL